MLDHLADWNGHRLPTRIVNVFEDVVAKNYIKQVGMEQLCQLGGIALFQRNLLCYSCLLGCTLR